MNEYLKNPIDILSDIGEVKDYAEMVKGGLDTVKPFAQAFIPSGIVELTTLGAAYTAGIVVYAYKKINDN